MFGLFGMISRSDPSSILQQIGRKILLSVPCNKKSWFIYLRSITNLYLLPDPLLLLQSPMSKSEWKKLYKAKVISYWEEKLRFDAATLSSLKFFSPQYMSLTKPHQIWSFPESGYEVQKAVIVVSMISGRYMSDYQVRHLSSINPEGFCQLCLAHHHASDSPENDDVSPPLGTLQHLLIECPALLKTRDDCKSLWLQYTIDKPTIRDLIINHDEEIEPSVPFLLDPTSCPTIIRAAQVDGLGIIGHILYLCRSWCYAIHVRRRKCLKLLNIIS